jgi:hypothetical protein
MIILALSATSSWCKALGRKEISSKPSEIATLIELILWSLKKI